MAVRMRLKRMGAKRQPSYRIVVADGRAPRDGKFIEELGHYNPRTEPVTLKIDEEKAKKWLSEGAKPSQKVRSLLAQAGVIN
ncbi:30S ribosomal protein S16 [Natranaerobius trueperi]|uniref:Small ribosomal subunit protein bS16 n=1 Tax=Natranaerobius trueperi TaxID=759412 RepID=A0A226BYV4_9FIRM|nr:30S ribosomal protein S16 [Natranaerobius trueperi]OWZ84203.1 30S ribosomal protein S16 [Natranaerobius trueperi]